MFLSSYSPLFALLAYTGRHDRRIWVTLISACVVSIVGLLIVMLTLRGQRGPALTVAHSRPQDGEVMSYIAAYLIPFLGLDVATQSGAVTLVVFLLVLMVVYVNSSLLFVNPVLSCGGYRCFEVEDVDGHAYSVLTRRLDVPPGTTFHPAQISRFIRVEVTR